MLPVSSDPSTLQGQVVQASSLTLLLFDNLSVTLTFSASKFKADINILKRPVTSLIIDKKRDTDLSWEARQPRNFGTCEDSQDCELLVDPPLQPPGDCYEDSAHDQLDNKQQKTHKTGKL